ncbi:hypothetical protein EV421DRAFT_1911534 [Armillaria borealis]|uniref:Uncharacterized protein n=1 Tax=Armillaria borealis TaxID=47425 RepID=A0AA39MFP9_9AGAR|nr:hypothetical protein EV421DRAFT_1911534 [Armillaria borealis]
MADPYYLLRAAMAKAPALWDTELFDSLSTRTVAQQVEEAHTLLTSYRGMFARPYSDLIERFFATASDAVHELPDRSFNDHWKVWLYGPAMVKEHLKSGRFTSQDADLLRAPSPAPMPSSSTQQNLKKRKTQHSPSPLTNSGKTRPGKMESQAKVEKPAPKRPKHDSSSSKVKESECASPPPTKALTSKVKTEPSAPTTEGSVTIEKSQVRSRRRKPAKIPIVEVPTVPRPKMKTPPPAIISEDTHVDIRGRSPTPVTAEYMLDRILTDLPTLSALRLPHRDAADCTMCAGHCRLCQHKEPLSSCANCAGWGHCSCRLSADDLQEVWDNVLPLAQAAHPLVEMHDRNFQAANRQIHHLLDALHEAYQIQTAALCNLLQAFSHVEGSHDTNALVNFARQYPVGRRLMIDMGLLAEDDGELQRVADPQLRHYYPRPLVVHSETTPEPKLPAFTGAEEEEDETAEGEQVAKVLEEDELPSSPVCPVKPAGSSIVDDIMSSWPEISRSVRRYGEEVVEEELSPWEREWLSPPSHSYCSLLRPDPYDDLDSEDSV